MTTPRTDPKGPKPTVSQAKAAWEAHDDPGLDNVLQALHDAGFTGTVRSTLYRWHKNGWPDHKSVDRRKASPPEDAVTIKQVAEKVADYEAAIEAKAVDAARAEILELRKLAPPPTTLDEAKRIDTLIGEILIARNMQLNAHALIFSKEGAKMLEALKATSASAAVAPVAASEPKTVGGIVIEHDAGERPLNQFEVALQQFQQERKLQVVK